jgi:hypothetical protein
MPSLSERSRLAGSLTILLVLLPVGCGEGEPPPAVPAMYASDVHDAFLANLAEHCGQAFVGRVIHVPADDPNFAGDPELIMHVRECSPEEVRIPVHLGDDRSRTWIFTRTAGGVDLRHDHRHSDGTPEPSTFYGAFVSDPPLALEAPTPSRHEFKREQESGLVSGWVVEIIPGERYTYGTQRDGVWRHRFDFDLTSSVEPPPDPWGHPPVGTVPALAESQEAFLENLAHHCGQAYHGVIAQRPDTDRLFRGDEVLTVHFRRCGATRLELPFHVEDNRSRTWLLTRTTQGIDLRHDHRHPDGTPEPATSTWYGAHTPDRGTAERQEFLREGTQNGAVTGWAIEIVPDERYTYGTIRNGEWVYRLDFDLTTAVDPPPAPWGYEES